MTCSAPCPNPATKEYQGKWYCYPHFYAVTQFEV